jgi:hypothetical protein
VIQSIVSQGGWVNIGNSLLKNLHRAVGVYLSNEHSGNGFQCGEKPTAG